MSETRAWVGCLACYNAGRLVGEWVEGTEAATFAEDATNDPAYVKGHNVPPNTHEEWWVFDHEGYGPMLTGECSPMEAQQLAEVLDKLPDHIPTQVFSAFVSNMGREYAAKDWAATVEGFEDSYAGEWPSVEAYAEDYAMEAGAYDENAVAWPLNCIDWEQAARELTLGGDIWTAEAPSGVYVFRSV